MTITDETVRYWREQDDASSDGLPCEHCGKVLCQCSEESSEGSSEGLVSRSVSKGVSRVVTTTPDPATTQTKPTDTTTTVGLGRGLARIGEILETEGSVVYLSPKAIAEEHGMEWTSTYAITDYRTDSASIHGNWYRSLSKRDKRMAEWWSEQFGRRSEPLVVLTDGRQDYAIQVHSLAQYQQFSRALGPSPDGWIGVEVEIGLLRHNRYPYFSIGAALESP